MERIVTIANNAIETVTLRRENKNLKNVKFSEDDLIGSSPKMLEIKEIIEKVAPSNLRVFITGANGTGKELIAKAIFKKSKRNTRPFIKVNCAAIPDELLESELFGHEKGAFTGAIARRIGKFEAANNGTIFLDEICDMSASAQAKVLRVLQEQELERVGGSEVIKVDVRVIAATNVDIQRAIERNEFREDLFFRLNGIPIHLPSLSEKKEDIPILAEHFIKYFSQEHGVGLKSFSDDGMDFLVNYNWPGNVRQLKNIIERVCVMIPGEVIDAAGIKKYLGSAESGNANKFNINKSNFKEAKEEFEREIIRDALKRKHGNVSSAAKELGLERTNLYRKIKQLDIDSTEYSTDE